jgi:hypothetical protein
VPRAGVVECKILSAAPVSDRRNNPTSNMT